MTTPIETKGTKMTDTSRHEQGESMTIDKPELDRRDVAVLLREASKRAKWYQTGEANLLLASAEEIERLRRWKAEALPVIDGLQELGNALGLPLGSSITGPEAAERARELTRERDVLAGVVAGVRELHEHFPGSEGELAWCDHCDCEWPCPTIQALDADGGAE